ncbi:MAG: tetratricopeptide (TPR) repeat protein [Myxococcota bacterium]|jgi:tetratricopeptide (TPR) repeat protein
MEAWLVDGRVDLQTGMIVREGRSTQQLSGLALACTRYLAEADGRVVSREELLLEVWGYRRGVRSRAVDTTVKVIRRLVERDPGAPAHLHTARGVGYRWEGVPAPAQPAVELIGRAASLAWLRASDCALLVVTGPPGVGKTALGAMQERQRVDLQGCSAISGFQRLGEALFPGLGPHTPETLASRIGDAVPRAIWLDHPEGLGVVFAEQVSEIFAGSALHVLVTTRDIRGWAGEIHRLAPLDVTDARVLLGRAWGHHEPAVVEALIPRLDGLPLALVLAGAVLRRLPSAALLGAGPSGMLAGSGALEAALVASWSQLSAELTHGLGHLAQLEGRVSLSDASDLLGEPAGPLLVELLTRSLIEIDEGGHYRLLRPIRDFVRARMTPAETADSRAAVVWWLASCCEAAGLRAYRTLSARQLDLERALSWAESDAHRGPLSHALSSFHYYHGDSAGLLRLALQAGTLSAPRWRVRLELWQALDFCGRGQAAMALSDLAAMEPRLHPDDLQLRWFFFAVQLRARLLAGDAHGALASAREMVSVAAGIGDAAMVGRSWADVALCAGRVGSLDVAGSACARALLLLDAAGDTDQIARVRSIQGRLLLESGDPEAAVEAFRMGLCAGAPRLEAMIRVGLGRSLAALSQPEAARLQLQKAARLARAFSDENTYTEAMIALDAVCGVDLTQPSPSDHTLLANKG